MKKLTLSIALVAGITLAKAQDTTCTMFQGKRVIEFNYKTRKVIVTFFDGTTFEEILDSKENVYYSPRGTTKVSVSKTRFFNKL